MAKKLDRDTLKRYFQKGALPSEDHFNDLIESVLNMQDDGFDKSPEHGLEVSVIDNNTSLISFFPEQNDPQRNDDSPAWTFRYNDFSSDILELAPGNNIDSLITFDGQHNRIGINTKTATEALEVNGFIKAKGVIGESQNEVPANGQYHDITGELEGCQGFEIVAGVGAKGTGIFGLIHAIALNAYFPNRWYDPLLRMGLGGIYTFIKKSILREENPKTDFFRSTRGIKVQKAIYDKGRIKLRWAQKSDYTYTLQLKSVCNCEKELNRRSGGEGSKVFVRYHLKALWQDEHMLSCLSQPTVGTSASTEK